MSVQKQYSTGKPIESLEEALVRCQNLGMRISHQRHLILELLWRSQEHLSAREIYNRLYQQGDKICPTAVYQNLAALSKQGIIECLKRSDGNLYSGFTASHSHLYCLDTSQIFNVWVKLPTEFIEEVERQTGTQVSDYQINFYGYCSTGTVTASNTLARRESTGLAQLS